MKKLLFFILIFILNFFAAFSFACDSCPTSNGFPIKTESIEEAQQRLRQEHEVLQRKYRNIKNEYEHTNSYIVPDRGPSSVEIDQMNLEELAKREKGIDKIIDKIIERNTKSNKAYIAESETLKKIASEKEMHDKNDSIKKLKEKCEALGFEMNTPKNGKCVLELMR